MALSRDTLNVLSGTVLFLILFAVVGVVGYLFLLAGCWAIRTFCGC